MIRLDADASTSHRLYLHADAENVAFANRRDAPDSNAVVAEFAAAAVVFVFDVACLLKTLDMLWNLVLATLLIDARW